MRLMAPAENEIDARFLALVEELSTRALDTAAPVTGKISPTSEPPSDGEGESDSDDAPAEKPEKKDD